jgi:hypothetical protein
MALKRNGPDLLPKLTNKFVNQKHRYQKQTNEDNKSDLSEKQTNTSEWHPLKAWHTSASVVRKRVFGNRFPAALALNCCECDLGGDHFTACRIAVTLGGRISVEFS